MSWNILRKATSEDYQKLGQKAIEFAGRHDLSIDPYDSDTDRKARALVTSLNVSIHCNSDRTYLMRLWDRIVGRALGHPKATGIAWGNVGYSMD